MIFKKKMKLEQISKISGIILIHAVNVNNELFLLILAKNLKIKINYKDFNFFLNKMRLKSYVIFVFNLNYFIVSVSKLGLFYKEWESQTFMFKGKFYYLVIKKEKKKIKFLSFNNFFPINNDVLNIKYDLKTVNFKKLYDLKNNTELEI
jgi:hypothetical protein